MGKPGFPIPPPGGRVWEGVALPRSMFIPSVCGAAAWTAKMAAAPRMISLSSHTVSLLWYHRVQANDDRAQEPGK